MPDELKAIFIEYAHRHFARYVCVVSRDRRYVWPDCGKPLKDLDAVRKRIEAKKDFITCQECGERAPLLDFIEQRLKSGKRLTDDRRVWGAGRLRCGTVGDGKIINTGAARGMAARI